MNESRDHDGYVVDNVFPSGYVAFLQPALLSYVAASAGYMPPEPQSGFVYLELGCGTGTTLNVLADANPQSQFVGVDFNPMHVAAARTEAEEFGLQNVTYIESSFQDVTIAELPECDYIAIHGAYSWLPPPAESAVHDIVDGKLRTGGIFFVDYLCAPARVPVSPVWYLLREITKHSSGASDERVAKGMEVLQLLDDAGSGYLGQNPPARQVVRRNLRRIDRGDPNVLRHLAHHALAEHQNERFFLEIRDTLRSLSLEFAGNCTTWRNSVEFSLPPGLRDYCTSQADDGISETIKDFLINQHQRKDVFIRDTERNPEAATEYLRKNVFLISMRPSAGVMTSWSADSGSAMPELDSEPAIGLILDVLDTGVTAFADIEARCLSVGLTMDNVIRALNALLGRPEIHLCSTEPNNPQTRPISEYHVPSQFNRSAETRRKKADRPNIILASSVLGAGLVLGPKHASMYQAHLGEQSIGDAALTNSDFLEPAIRHDFERRILPRLQRLRIVH